MQQTLDTKGLMYYLGPNSNLPLVIWPTGVVETLGLTWIELWNVLDPVSIKAVVKAIDAAVRLDAQLSARYPALLYTVYMAQEGMNGGLRPYLLQVSDAQGPIESASAANLGQLAYMAWSTRDITAKAGMVSSWNWAQVAKSLLASQ